MRTKTLLTILALISITGFIACHAGPASRPMDFGTDDAQTPGLGAELESGESEVVPVEADKSSLFNAINPQVDVAIIVDSKTHKELIKDTLQDSVDPTDWSKVEQLFNDCDIVEFAVVARQDVFGDEPLIFIKFAEPLSSTELSAFDTYATAQNWGKQTYDLDGDGQPDEDLYITYKSSLAVTPSSIDKFILNETETGERVNCLDGVNNASALIGCGYLHREMLKKALDFPSYDSSKAVAWFHLFKDETLVLNAKLLDDDESVSSFTWNFDGESSFAKNFFKKIFG